ncbi:MAG: hypothetical protein WC712_07520 [Candidatus Brocadiia bacterium]
MNVRSLVLVLCLLLVLPFTAARCEDKPPDIKVSKIDLGEAEPEAWPCHVFAVEGNVCGLMGVPPGGTKGVVEYRDLKTGATLLSLTYFPGGSILGRDEQADYNSGTGKLRRWIHCLTKPEEIASVQLEKNLKTPWDSAAVECSSNDWWVLVSSSSFILVSRKDDRLLNLPIISPGKYKLHVNGRFAVAAFTNEGPGLYTTPRDNGVPEFFDNFFVASLDAEAPNFRVQKLDRDAFVLCERMYVGLCEDRLLVSSITTPRERINGAAILYSINSKDNSLEEVRHINGSACFGSYSPAVIGVLEDNKVISQRIEGLAGTLIRDYPDSIRFPWLDSDPHIVVMKADGGWIEGRDAAGHRALQRADGSPTGVTEWDKLREQAFYNTQWVDGCLVLNPVSRWRAPTRVDKVREVITILDFGKGSVPGFGFSNRIFPFPIG